jgi:hypothetical protein
MAMNPRLLRPLASGEFDPRRIANLTGWYLATDSTSYTESSGRISEWRDKSGAGNHVTQTVSNNNMPTLFESSGDTQNTTRAVINGRQALFFDGVNDRLLTTNTVTSGQSRTVFAVLQRTNNSTTATVAAFGDTSTASNQRWLCRVGRDAERAVGGDSVATNQLIGTVLAWDTAHVSCWSQNSSTRNLTYLFDNVSYAITGNPPQQQSSFAGLIVGMLQISVAIQFLNGRLGELVIYDRELSVSERDTVTRGIAKRWGITVA